MESRPVGGVFQPTELVVTCTGSPGTTRVRLPTSKVGLDRRSRRILRPANQVWIIHPEHAGGVVLTQPIRLAQWRINGKCFRRIPIDGLISRKVPADSKLSLDCWIPRRNPADSDDVQPTAAVMRRLSASPGTISASGITVSTVRPRHSCMMLSNCRRFSSTTGSLVASVANCSFISSTTPVHWQPGHGD